MRQYRVILSPSAQKDMQRLDRATRKKVDKAILKLHDNPFLAHTQKLVNHPDATYRYRIGNWRIFFDVVPDNTVRIIHIWSRGKDYKK